MSLVIIFFRFIIKTRGLIGLDSDLIKMIHNSKKIISTTRSRCQSCRTYGGSQLEYFHQFSSLIGCRRKLGQIDVEVD